MFGRATITLGIGPLSSIYLLWPLCGMGQAIIFCPVVSYIFFLYLLSFFHRLISAVADWMSTILLHMVWP